METEKSKRSLSEKLFDLRKAKGLTQAELAEMLQVSRQAISRWEVGTAVPSTDKLKLLCQIYDVPVDSLLRDDAELEDSNENGQPPDSPSHSRKRKRIVAVFGCLVGIILFLVFTNLILVFRLRAISESNQEKSTPTPIEDLNVDEPEEWQNYDTFTFSFGIYNGE